MYQGDPERLVDQGDPGKLVDQGDPGRLVDQGDDEWTTWEGQWKENLGELVEGRLEEEEPGRVGEGSGW